MSEAVADCTGDDCGCSCDDERVFLRLLNHELARQVHVDVVKVKRDRVLLKLNTAELALECKDYIATYVFLAEICKIIEEDEYPDEYQLDSIEMDMLFFSTCVSCALSKYYSKAEELMSKLLSKSHNPVFCYIFALIHLYQLNFKEARRYMEKALPLLNDYHQQDKIVWPWTDIAITNISNDELKTKIILCVYFISAMNDVTCEAKAISFGEKYILDKFSLSASRYKEVKLNGKKQHIGRFLKHKIYGLIRAGVCNLMGLRLSNLPDEFKIAAVSVHRKLGHYFGIPSVEVVRRPDIKKVKHKLTQTSVKVQNAQTQAHSIKILHRYTQTIESGSTTSEADEERQQTLKQTLAKLKIAEANVVSLKAKKLELEEKLKIQEEYHLKQKEKWLVQEQQNNLKLVKLQAQVEVLQEKKDRQGYQLMESNQQLYDCIALLSRSYKSRFKATKQSYQSFVAKCHTTIDMLNDVKKNLTSNTMFTFEETQSSLNKWEATLMDSIRIQSELENNYKVVKETIAESRFSDLFDVPEMPSFPNEPPSLANQYFLALVMCLSELVKPCRFSKETQTYETPLHELYVCGVETMNLDAAVTSFQGDGATIALQCSTTNKKLSSYATNRNSPQNNVLANCNGHVEKGEPIVTKVTIPPSNKKLYSYIKSKLPLYDESEIHRAVNVFREQNNGKLTGLTVQYICSNVRKILGAPQPGWEEIKSNCNKWDSDNSESCCSICFAFYNELPVTTLKCQHKFHTECIRKWLLENSTCAICRMYVTMDEDFPPLKT